MQKILVTGGTGLVGSYLIRHLLRQGHQVRALKRASSKMGLVDDIKDKVEWVEGDILDIFALEDAMKGIDNIYHCAAVVSFDPRDRQLMYQTNIEGTANVVNIALDSNIKKLVHVSSISALGRVKNFSTLSENTKWETSKHNSHYSITKYESEQEVWRGIAEGLNAVIVNPSMIMGAGYWDSGTCGFFTKVWNGLKFYPQGGTGYVDVRDVVEVMQLLMDSEINNERFVLSSADLTYKEFFNLIGQFLNKKAPSIKVNKWIGETAWRVEYIKSLLTNSRPLVTKETYHSSSKTFYFDGAKIEKAVNFSYLPIEKTIKDTCEVFIKTYPEGRAYGVF